MFVLEFEKPIFEIRSKIAELQQLSQNSGIDVQSEIVKLTNKANKLEKKIFSDLNVWQKTQLARHPNRINTLEFIEQAATNYYSLQGDRAFRDDASIVGGFAFLEKYPFMIIGHQKGKNTNENVMRNFGMPHPEGYRKSLRLMKLAERFNIPILTLIDTPGAYPGIAAEERGQSEAIAVNLREMAGITVPIISIVTGEGGSGGAIALGVANHIMMLEYAIYSVISPEGCASILWGDAEYAQTAAEQLNYTAENLLKIKVIDEIITEPLGGSHNDTTMTAKNIKKAVINAYLNLKKLSAQDIALHRLNKIRKIDQYVEEIHE